MEKENNSKPNKAKSTSASNSTNSKAKRNAKAKNGITDSKISDNAIKDTNKATKSNLKASQTENDVKPEEKRDDLTLASQEEKIKKNAGKDSKRKKAAVATAVVLLLIAGVTVPTAVYLSRRKVSVDISNNVDVIQEYTINIKRGTTIKDIVPQEIKGYTFVGFFKDAALTNPYKDTDKINKDTTIYAKYEANIYKVTLPTSPSFTIEGEGIVNNQVEVEYNSEYSFKLNLNAGYDESDIIVKVNGEALTPDQEGYYTITINGDMVIVVEGVEINTYEVTFYDSLEKNEIYQNQEIEYNQLCTYTGVMPTKTNTHTYKYTFIGWVNAQGEPVDLTTTRIVSDLELFADFKAEYIEYSIHKPEQVNIQNEEGIYLSNTATLHYGDIVTITYDTTQGYDVTAFEVNGAEKVAGSENQYRITGNLEVIYTEEIQTFTVSIAVNNADYGTVSESSITVDYGTEITVSGNTITISDTTITATPATATAQYTYAFASWSTGNTTVTGDLIITATFTQTVNTYTVTWQNWDGSILDTNLEVEYGTTPIYNGSTPIRTDANYIYEFTGWSPAVSSVTGDVTYTAQFDQVAELLPYEIDSGGWITKYTGTATEVVIPSTYSLLEDGTVIAGTDYTITGIADAGSSLNGAFYNKNITSVTLPDTIEKIGAYAFYNCTSLTSVTFGENSQLTSIGAYAFYDCTSLTSITISENVTSIERLAFYNCTSLTSVIFRENSQLTGIGEQAFNFCTSLTNITIPASVTSIVDAAFWKCENLEMVIFEEGSQLESIGDNAFAECISLTSITIPDGVTSIGVWTFGYCTSLTSITIPDSVTSIGDNAFSECISLTSITIPNSVTSIGAQAFFSCTGLTEINFNATNMTDLESYNSVFAGAGMNGEGVIVNIGANVQRIPAYLFGGSGSVNIITVNFSENSQCIEIGDYAFAQCSNLTNITIPESVTSIGDSALAGCTRLTSIIIPNSVVNIGNSVFYDCNELTDITIGNGVTNIGEWAFQNCTGLKDVYYTGDINDWVSILFDPDGDSSDANPIKYTENFYINGELVTEANIDRATEIGARAFYGYEKLASVTIGDQVTSIGNSAFANCIGLTTITIPAGVNNIGASAFASCTGLTDVTFENVYGWTGSQFEGETGGEFSPTELQNTSTAATYLTDTYKNYYWLREDVEVLNFEINDSGEITKYTGTATEVVIPSTYSLLEDGTVIAGTDYTITGIADGTASNGAFYNNKNITSVTLPNTIEEIGSYAFENCSNLTSITIPASVTSIGNSAFSQCGSLTSITIPNSVTSIGSRAFYGCDNLANVYYEGTIEEWIDISFGGYGANPLTNGANLYVNGDELVTEINIDTATTINAYVFSGCISLTKVTIGSQVTYIGNFAFDRCGALTEINYNATNLADLSYDNRIFSYAGIDGVGIVVNIGANVQQIPAYLFIPDASSSYYIPKIVSVNFAENSQCTEIGGCAFYGCEGLTSITIPASVTSIGSSAFYGCDNLANVYYEGTIEEWIDISFGNPFSGYDANPLTNGANLYVNGDELVTEVNFDSATTIKAGVFQGCKSLTKVTIGSQVTSIGSSAFEGCTGLTSITIPDSVTSIGVSAFERCRGLTSITISESVTEISSEAFQSCTGLTSITIPSSVTNIGSFAFDGCTGLTSITIPESVTIIGYATFQNCSSLTSITIPESVTSIGNNAFSSCTGLTSITIPASVTSIGNYAFSGCNLTSVTIESNYAYKNAGTGYNQCGRLLQYATVVRVLTSCIGTDTNSYLEDTANFTKTTSEDGLYYIYTKV